MAAKPKMKVCSCCGVAYPVDDFGPNRQTPDGLAYYTREHAAAKQRAHRRANPQATREARERYLDKLRAQNDARRSGS